MIGTAFSLLIGLMALSLPVAAALGLMSVPALAQYSSSGTQAGGPRAGMERRMGAPGGMPSGSYGVAPRSYRAMRHHERRMMRRHDRHHRY